MKLYMRGIAALVLSAGTIAVVGGTSAQAQTCSGGISNTGPGSDNSIDCEVKNENTYICKNGIWVKNDNKQDADSGDATNGGNTSGGDATSGNAGNDNSTDVDIVVGGACAPGTTTGGGGNGGGGGGGAAPQPTVTPAASSPQPMNGMGAAAGGVPMEVLPDTANSAFLAIAGTIVSALAGTAGIAKLGTLAYVNYFQNRK